MIKKLRSDKNFSNFLIDPTEDIPSYKVIADMKGRRFMNAHLPIKLLPPSFAEKQVKTIYVARHPKDVVVSYFYHNQLVRFLDKSKSFSEYFDFFMRDLRKHLNVRKLPYIMSHYERRVGSVI